MIEVEVGVHHHIDIGGMHSQRVEPAEQITVIAGIHPVTPFRRNLRAHTGIDERGVTVAAHE